MEWMDLRSDEAKSPIPPKLQQRLVSGRITHGTNTNEEAIVDIQARADAWEMKLARARARRAQVLQGRRVKAASMRPGKTKPTQKPTASHTLLPSPSPIMKRTCTSAHTRQDAAALTIQQWWRDHREAGTTTAAMVAAYTATGLVGMLTADTMDDITADDDHSTEEDPASHQRTASDRELCDAFDTLAQRIAAPATLTAATMLLQRVHAMRTAMSVDQSPAKDISVALGQIGGGGSSGSAATPTAPRQQRASSPPLLSSKPLPASAPTRAPRTPSRKTPPFLSPPSPATITCRYPPRVLLSAYMMVAHPEVVFNEQSVLTDAVGEAARGMLGAFHALLLRLTLPVVQHDDVQQGVYGVWQPEQPQQQRLHTVNAEKAGDDAKNKQQKAPPRGDVCKGVVAFDDAWVSYVQCFAAWKAQDAQVIEGDLVRMAVEMELSLHRKIGPHGRHTPRVAASPDLQAMCEQVQRDQTLMREHLVCVSGEDAGQRMDIVLGAVREKLLETFLVQELIRHEVASMLMDEE